MDGCANPTDPAQAPSRLPGWRWAALSFSSWTPGDPSGLALDAQFGGDFDQRGNQAVHMLFGVGGGARNAQQVLRRGRTQHRIDVDAFFEQLFAQAAEIEFLVDR